LSLKKKPLHRDRGNSETAPDDREVALRRVPASLPRHKQSIKKERHPAALKPAGWRGSNHQQLLQAAAVPQLLLSESETAEWLFPQEKATLRSSQDST
jgi:hypothetical protein